MNILSIHGVSKSYGEKVVLNDVTFGIEDADRIALVGVNGTGKSTLLKMVAGLDAPESGNITVGSGIRIHYLPQEPVFQAGSTVLEQVFFGDLPVMRTLRVYEEVVNKLAKAPGDEALQKQLIRLQAEMDALGAFTLEHEAKAVLTRLGIDNFDADVNTLSGGQKKRVAMARALIQPCDLLILDEPTNHIDHDSVEWLESTLVRRKGALLMVTHDRYFLDRVVTRIFELDRGSLFQYKGRYETYLQMKMEREESKQASEEKRKNFLRNEIEWVKRGPQGRATKQKARMDRYQQVLAQEAQAGPGAVDITAASTRLGKSVVELSDVSKGFFDEEVIRDFSYTVLPDDRIGIVGANGMGKSTLLKIISGQLEPDMGQVKIGQTVKIGYFAQEQTDMNPDQRVLEYVREVAEYVETAAGETISAAQMLERFLFPSTLQWTPIGKLSGGEKRRLVLLRMLVSAPNVLLLDEPTNDLDISTLAILEDYLDDFKGAVVVVSHDRYFLNRVAKKIFAFEGDGVISVVHGNFSDYVDWRENQGRTQSEKSLVVDEKQSVEIHPEDKKSDGLSHGDRRQTLRFTFKEQKEYEEIDARIEEAEQDLARVQSDMSRNASDHVKLLTLAEHESQLKNRLDELIERWTYLNELAEKIEAQRQY